MEVAVEERDDAFFVFFDDLVEFALTVLRSHVPTSVGRGVCVCGNMHR